MDTAPELRIDIPVTHPWAQTLIWRRPSEWPTATMTFADTECLVQFCGTGGVVYGHGLHPDFLQTTWRALPTQPNSQIENSAPEKNK